jgi:hypothetical protein
MKKLIFLLLFIPVIGFSQSAKVITSWRVFPTPGKTLEFKKALQAHMAKYHTTDRKWRIFEIMSGPDAGAFHFTEGPMSWDDMDKQAANTDAHTTDWDKTVEVFVSKTTNTGYSVYSENLSTAAQGDITKDIILTHMYVNPGMVGSATALVEKMKKAWVLGNESIAVYNTSASGEPQMVISRRLKTGLKEMDPSFMKSMPDRYREANGPNSWAEYSEEYAKAFSSRWSEHLQLRTDLSSK